MLHYQSLFSVFLFSVLISISACKDYSQARDSEKIILNTSNIEKEDTLFFSLDAALNSSDYNLIYELSLRDRGFKEFPKEIFLFKNLKKLDLTFNDIAKIPDDINKLSNLESLSLGWNYISEISSNIGELRGLKNLTLARNNIKELPSSICNLNKLKRLNLIENSLKDLPSCMKQLLSLEDLALSRQTPKISKKIIQKLKKDLPDCNIGYGRVID